MKEGKLLVNEIPSLGILTNYAFCCTGRTNWLQKVTTPCLFPDEFSSLPFCFFDHSLLLFIIHIWFICIVALSNKGPIACTQLIQLAVMNLSSVTTRTLSNPWWKPLHRSSLAWEADRSVVRWSRDWSESEWWKEEEARWGSGSASGGIVSRGLPAPNDFPPLCQRKKGGKEKSEETRKEMISISLSTSKNLPPLSALIRNHGILSFLATQTKQGSKDE